jgi:hypothetical protein
MVPESMSIGGDLASGNPLHRSPCLLPSPLISEEPLKSGLPTPLLTALLTEIAPSGFSRKLVS